MRLRLPAWSLALGLTLPVLLVACGGDDDDDGLVDTPVPPAIEQRLANLQSAFTSVEFTGVYTIETTNGDGSMAGEALYTSRPPDYLAVSFSGQFSGVRGKLVTIRTPDATYICQQSESDDAPEPFCLEGSESLVGLGDLAQLNLSRVVSALAQGSDYEVEEAESQEIAGRDGKCFTFTSSEGEGLVCFEEETGIMLLVESTSGNTTLHLKATDIDDDTDDGAFVPPFELLEVG